MESKTIYCGKCGKENPSNNNFCYNCGQKLIESILNNSIKPAITDYNDIRLALEQLVVNNGFIIISQGDYYVQFDNNLQKGRLYFDALSQANFPGMGNKDDEFAKLLFKIEKNNNYYKFIQTEKISIENLIKEIDIIFNKIYGITFNNYDIKIEIDEVIKPITSETINKNSDKVIKKTNHTIYWVLLVVVLFSLWLLYVIKNGDNKKVIDNTFIKEEQSQESSQNESKNNQNNVQNDISTKKEKSVNKNATYKSTSYDKEYNGTIIQTNNETSYHTFDFNNMTVKQKSILNGQWITLTYPMESFYVEKGIVATTYVITVHKYGVKEIWYSPDVPNLGYDYDDGSRISCYNLTKIK